MFSIGFKVKVNWDYFPHVNIYLKKMVKQFIFYSVYIDLYEIVFEYWHPVIRYTKYDNDGPKTLTPFYNTLLGYITAVCPLASVPGFTSASLFTPQWTYCFLLWVSYEEWLNKTLLLVK